jgi:hypothetical protein
MLVLPMREPLASTAISLVHAFSHGLSMTSDSLIRLFHDSDQSHVAQISKQALESCPVTYDLSRLLRETNYFSAASQPWFGVRPVTPEKAGHVANRYLITRSEICTLRGYVNSD